MKNILVVICCYMLINGFSIESNQKNYVYYHRGFAEVEELVVNEKFMEAESKLDTLFAKYEVKFAKDYVIAGQVCFINEHKNKGMEFLRCALRKGVKVDCLKSIRLFNEKITKAEWNQLEIEANQLRKEYLKNIDLSLYQEFHNRYQEEQDSKQSERYKSIVYSNFNRIKNIIESRGFPGETIIGIDNQTLAKSISDCGCGNATTVVTLLHYDYPISEIGNEKLISEIENGNLHPREFAVIYSFEESKVSELYKESNKKYDDLPKYYFNFPFGRKTADIGKVNADRDKFGICKCEVDEKKIETGRKYGMKLEFSYR